MPDPAVRAGLDQFVIFTERGFEAPMFAEMASGCPGERNRWRAEQHGGNRSWRGFVKVYGPDVSPHQREAYHYQRKAPFGRGRRGHFYLSGRLSERFHESQ